MPNIVVAGALLSCAQGMMPAVLSVLPLNRVMVENKPAANVMDYKYPVNIPVFGMCRSPVNPAVVSATAAAMGVFTPAPCLPVLIAPWVPGSAKARIAGMPALTNTSTCQCSNGGVIHIVQPGTLRSQIA